MSNVNPKADQPIVDNPIRAALEAAVAGKDPEKEVYGKDTGMFEGNDLEDDYQPIESGTSPLEELEASLDQESDPNSEPESDPKDEVEDSQQLAGQEDQDLLSQVENSEVGDSDSKSDIETITVKGEFSDENPEGRGRTKVKIDYSDREAIKKAYVEAAGMRRAFTKANREAKSHKDTQAKLDSLQGDWDKIEEAWSSDGVKGIVSILSQNNPNAWQEAVDAEIEQRNFIAQMSPEDRYKYDLNLQQEAASKKETELEKKYQDLYNKQLQAEERAQEKKLESQLHPTFDRYRFAGKLGDAVAEAEFDESMWLKVTNRLAQYPEDKELTQAIIDKEFRTVANRMRKHLNVQVEKKLKKAVNNQKAEASKRAQVIASKGLSGSGAKREFVENMKKGDFRAGFMDIIQGKVKL